MLDRFRQSIEEGRGLSPEEFWQAVEQRHAEREPGDSGEESIEVTARKAQERNRRN
jgi:hypothetical protein